MAESILVEEDGGVLWIRLNRPEVYNVFNDEMGLDFLKALEQAKESHIRCVVVIGEGKGFCAGEDLRALSGDYEQGTAPDLGEILERRYNPAIEAILSLDKPVIAGINGVAAGAGVSLALACDYRLMAEDASLVLAFAKVGLIPDAGATWLLPKYLGVGRALELSFSGDPLTAGKAEELGLVNGLAPSADIRRVVREKANELANGPTAAYGLMKKLIWRAAGEYLSKHLAEEAKAQTSAGKTADHLEGVTAFTEKRKPNFFGK